jgi:hypothetical protein
MSLVMIEKYESEQARSEHARGAALSDLRSALAGNERPGCKAHRRHVRSLPVPPHADTRGPLNGGKTWTARQAAWFSPTSRPSSSEGLSLEPL